MCARIFNTLSGWLRKPCARKAQRSAHDCPQGQQEWSGYYRVGRAGDTRLISTTWQVRDAKNVTQLEESAFMRKFRWIGASKTKGSFCTERDH